MSGLDRARYAELLEARATKPESFVDALRQRSRRRLLGEDRRLLIIAADHTARGILAAGAEPYAIADRYSLLNRLMRALSNPSVDGVLASADIIEELAWLGALESKLVFGTMNRGGYFGSMWGLDDRMTAYDADHIASLGLNGGKVMLRIEHTDMGVARTLEEAATVVRLLAERNLVCLIEPLPYTKDASGLPALNRETNRLDKVISIAAGLGGSSATTWLKLPAWTSAQSLARATSMPILLLGGDPGENIEDTVAEWKLALETPNVIGLVAGRPLLFPHGHSVEDIIGRVAQLVHG